MKNQNNHVWHALYTLNSQNNLATYGIFMPVDGIFMADEETYPHPSDLWATGPSRRPPAPAELPGQSFLRCAASSGLNTKPFKQQLRRCGNFLLLLFLCKSCESSRICSDIASPLETLMPSPVFSSQGKKGNSTVETRGLSQVHAADAGE